MRKGIILAGGTGSRLYPLTFSISKQLLPVYDKPMIFYPLSTLIEFNIKDILIITKPSDQLSFQKLLGDGSNFGVNLSYETQDNPKGIAEGLIIGEKFLSHEPSAFILGDNLFIGSIKNISLDYELKKKDGATIFTYKVKDPERYGVVTLNNLNLPINITEKPKLPTSNNAITGLYLYDGQASEIAKTIKPSYRGELEITDVNKHYLNQKKLSVSSIDNDVTWLDAGTIESLYDSSDLVATIEKRTGKKVACLEEIAFFKKNISIKKLENIRLQYGASDYGLYLQNIIDQELSL